MRGRILALDFGEKRIGVAVTDLSGTLASPLKVIHRRARRKDVEAVQSLVEQVGAVRVVVGLPLNSKGEQGAQAHKAISFARRLAASLSIPVFLWDERLTTVEAEALLKESGKSIRRRHDIIDAAAAAVILQSYVDALRTGSEEAKQVEFSDRDADEKEK